MCTTIKHTLKFKAHPADVYTHLVSDSDTVGGRFTLGAASGIVVDLATDERVVRAWREPDDLEGLDRLLDVDAREAALRGAGTRLAAGGLVSTAPGDDPLRGPHLPTRSARRSR